MAAVTRLLTLVDICDSGADALMMSVSARHEAVLADGRRVVLLDDRGWGGTVAVDSAGRWASETVEEMERTARVVVGPDEPPEGRSQADMEMGHWQALSRTLRQHGVDADVELLKTLPHDVELSDRVHARLGHG